MFDCKSIIFIVLSFVFVSFILCATLVVIGFDFFVHSIVIVHITSTVDMVLILILLFYFVHVCSGDGDAKFEKFRSNLNVSSKNNLDFNLMFLNDLTTFPSVTGKSCNNCTFYAPVLLSRMFTILGVVSGETLQDDLEDIANIPYKDMDNFHKEHTASIKEENIELRGMFGLERLNLKNYKKELVMELIPIYNITVIEYSQSNAKDYFVNEINKLTRKMFYYNFAECDYDYIDNEFNVGAVFNTLYFKADFKKRFSSKPNVNMSFYSHQHSKPATVSMMTLKGQLRAKKDDNRKIRYVELPFKSTRFSLMIILPTERFTLRDVLRNFTGAVLKNILEEEKPLQKVNLYLPELKLSNHSGAFPMTCKGFLKDVIEKFGLPTMFSSSYYDPSFGNLGPDLDRVFVKNIDYKIALLVQRGGIRASGIISVYLETMTSNEPYYKSNLSKTLPQALDEVVQETNAMPNRFSSKFPSSNTNKKSHFKFEKTERSETMEFKCDEPYFMVLFDKWHVVPLVWGIFSFDA